MSYRRPRRCSRADCGRNAAFYAVVSRLRRRYLCPLHAAAIAADEILHPIEALR